MGGRLAAAAVALVLLTPAGCGDDGRQQVERYIADVNAIQAELREPLTAVAQGNREFSAKGSDPVAVERRLRRSEETLRGLRDEVAALSTPAAAAPLRKALLALVGAEAELAAEVTALARYLPALRVALDPLQPASEALSGKLDSAATRQEQRSALLAYRIGVKVSLVRLQALEPPPALLPSHRAQETTLVRIDAAAAAFSLAILENDREAIPGLVARFANAGRAARSVSAQKAQIAAIKAYNARVRRIQTLASRVGVERRRLQTELG